MVGALLVAWGRQPQLTGGHTAQPAGAGAAAAPAGIPEAELVQWLLQLGSARGVGLEVTQL